MTKNNHSHNFVSDPDEVAAFLTELIKGFKDRNLVLKFNDREVTLKPGEILDLSLETTNRKGHVKLRVDILWPENESRSRPSLFQLSELEK
jgi:amphi-Trp domain-containing protein